MKHTLQILGDGSTNKMWGFLVKIPGVLPLEYYQLPKALFPEGTKKGDLVVMDLKSTITLDQAKAAKAVLKAEIGQPLWLRGIGIAQKDQDYIVKVNVADESGAIWAATQMIQAVKDRLGGVEVEIDVVGDITALEESE